MGYLLANWSAIYKWLKKCSSLFFNQVPTYYFTSLIALNEVMCIYGAAILGRGLTGLCVVMASVLGAKEDTKPQIGYSIRTQDTLSVNF